MKKSMLLIICMILIFTIMLSACKPSEQSLMATDAINTAQAIIIEQTAKAKIIEDFTQTAAAMPATNTPILTNTEAAAVEAATSTKQPVAQQATSGDAAQFVEETVPDGTTFAPGVSFTKTWRLKNTGTYTWTSDYQVIFLRGDAMNSPATQALGSSVSPGTTVVISLNLKAPEADGTYEGYWMLRNPSGRSFGTGGNNFPISTVIKVSSNVTTTTTVTPTTTTTVTPTNFVFAVTDITIISHIPANGQPCGQELNFETQANITANGSGIVKYRWQNYDGNVSDTVTASFSSAGTQTSTTQNTGVAATTDIGSSGWVAIEILSPNNIRKQYDWTYQCTPP
ncbi:hypothetical protein EH221_01635 [bacterium]|nr:MAG: hypothetical protein EH221_01635 [bacterium]